MKLHVNTLLDFGSKYSLKNKSHIYNLINQEVLIHNILKRFPDLKNGLKNFQDHQVVVTLRFSSYDFRKTYLRWIYNHFSKSAPNRRQIHKNEIISLIEWAKHFNKNSRYLKFLTIEPKADDYGLKANLRILGFSLVSNKSVSFDIRNAIKTEYPDDGSSSLYQFERITGDYLVNSLQANFKRCVPGFPFTLVNEAPDKDVMLLLKRRSQKPHKLNVNNKLEKYKSSEIKSESVSNPKPKSKPVKRSESTEFSSSSSSPSKSSSSKEKPSERAKKMKSSILLSKASSAGSSLSESISRSRAAQAESKSQSFSNISMKASSSAASSKAMSQYSAKVSLNYSYSSVQSHQVSLAKSRASSRVSNAKRSLSISASTSAKAQVLESQSQLRSNASVGKKRNHIASSFETQSIKAKSSTFSSESSEASQKSQSSVSSQGLNLDSSLNSYGDKLASNSDSYQERHVRWQVEKMYHPKIIPFVIIVLMIVLLGILFFELQKDGIIN